ncbi:MAG TPA: NrtA/SsuA/CpmA family ABC transporter substrate-binding protein [Dissulfurispiraceae bacterium]|nr:NrtA/SsuA/CpmA family ABC transporter substrate-binding protein [Dissulfurispiraceae bacterium]
MLTACSLLLSLLWLVSFGACPAGAADNAATHPIYATYQFDTSGKTIHFGVQPLAAPEGLIAAVMQRDPILRDRLRVLGLTLKFYPFQNGADANYFMRRGDIHIAMASGSSTLVGAAVSDISILARAKDGASSVVARKKINSLKDLKGKRVAYSTGSTAHIDLLMSLSALNLNAHEVILVPMEASQFIAALTNGQIDAFSAWEPTPSIARAESPILTTVLKVLNSGYLYANRSLLEHHPAAVDQILASYVRAIRWLWLHDKNLTRGAEWWIQEANAFLQKQIVVNPEVIKKIAFYEVLRFGDPVLPASDFAEHGYLHKRLQLLQAHGMIDPAVSWVKIRESLNSRALKKILDSPNKFRLNIFAYETR